MDKKKGMSFVEKAGLFFGIVGVLADFTALVSFTYGFASLQQFTPAHVSVDSATSFFRWFSGLVIIYTWFITSWYLTRRTFVLRYEKPRAYKNPLNSRSTRTIFGVGLFLVPTFIFWSIVNISFSVSADHIKAVTTPQVTETFTSTEIITGTPTDTSSSVPTLDVTPFTETLTPSPTGINVTAPPTATLTPEEITNRVSLNLGFMYYAFFFPLGIGFFGLIIYACLNSLMPIVHVELLDDYE